MEENKVMNEEVVEKVENEAVPVEESAVKEEKTNSDSKTNRRPNKDRRPRGDRRERAPKAKLYEEVVVNINRVSKTVKGGRKLKFSALVVVGDRKGKYGFGTGKASEVPEAIRKAVEAAHKNITKVAIVKNDTIPHDIVGKFGATKVFLKPAKEGTGIIAGGPVRSVLELSGIKNVYSKVYGSRTAINVIRATDDAIRNLKTYTKTQDLRK